MNYCHVVDNKRKPFKSMYCLPMKVAESIAIQLSEEYQDAYLFEAKPDEAILEVTSVEINQGGLFDIEGVLHICVDHTVDGQTNELIEIARRMSDKIKLFCDVVMNTKFELRQNVITGTQVFHLKFESSLVDLSEGDVLSLSGTLDRVQKASQCDIMT